MWHGQRSLEATLRRGSLQERNYSDFCLILPEQNYFEVADETGLVHAKELSVSSLDEFELWWNALSSRLAMWYPVSIEGDVKSDIEGRTSSELSIFGTDPQKKENCTSSTDRPSIPLKFGKFSMVTKADYQGSFPTSVANKSETFGIVVTGFGESRMDQTSLVVFFKNWRRGDFNRSFSDLTLAARDLGSLELEDISKIVDSEATRDVDVFEVLGLKIPIAQLAAWGSIVVLGIQIYLLLFLKQLSGKLGAEDPGWDVPWIGMDQTKFAQRMLFLTLVLLPCIAVAVLGGRAISLMVADYSDPEVWWKLTMSRQQGIVLGLRSFLVAAVFTAACVLSARSWKYRPKTVQREPMPSCPPQLFE